MNGLAARNFGKISDTVLSGYESEIYSIGLWMQPGRAIRDVRRQSEIYSDVRAEKQGYQQSWCQDRTKSGKGTWLYYGRSAGKLIYRQPSAKKAVQTGMFAEMRA